MREKGLRTMRTEYQQSGVNVHALVAEVEESTNEVIKITGTRDGLNTVDKSTLVAAINEVNKKAEDAAAPCENLEDLQTTEKGTLVGAVNEIHANAQNLLLKTGDLDTLETENKTDLVAAINELNGNLVKFMELLSNHVEEIEEQLPTE